MWNRRIDRDDRIIIIARRKQNFAERGPTRTTATYRKKKSVILSAGETRAQTREYSLNDSHASRSSLARARQTFEKKSRS